jgi:glycosyltransferase involved in cell wall biosynthesis
VAAHVVHVGDYGNPAPGSFIPAIFALARRLRARGDRCSLITPDVAGAVWHDAARANLDRFETASSPSELYRRLWRAAPDVVHVHFVGWSLPATLVGYLKGVPVIWHLHSAMRDAGAASQRLVRTAKYAWFGRGVRRFVAVSDALRSAVVRMGVAPARAALIRNAVDTAHFRPPSPQEKAAARAAFGLRPSDRVLLHFGRDVRIKGGDILWDALSRVRDVVLIAVGLPPDAQREFAARVRTIALPFVADTAQLYWAADVLAMPSRREGAPYTMLEALCSGLPVVASEIESLAEIGRCEPSVRLVRNEPAALAEALREPSSPPAEAVAATRTRFGLDRWVSEVSGLYAA